MRMREIMEAALVPPGQARAVQAFYREYGDDIDGICAPATIHFMTGVPFDEVLAACKRRGWTQRRGLVSGLVPSVLSELGFASKERHDLAKARATDPVPHLKARTLGQLVKIIPPGSFLVGTDGHTLGIKDGEVFDIAYEGSRRRVQTVLEILR